MSRLLNLDLSKIRHDLRLPINQIIGYCELLQEEGRLPAGFMPDLERIRKGGQQLLTVISEYFDENKFDERRRNLPQVYHDLRTPVNHIIGYSEMLQEQCHELKQLQYLADLQRIHLAAHTWLELMEEYLLPSINEDGTDAEAPQAPPAVGFRTLPPRSADAAALTGHGRILVVDDDPTNRELLSRRLSRHGYEVHPSDSGIHALRQLRHESFDLVLLDLVMQGLDGYQVLCKMKADPALRNIPVLMISGLDQENGIARCIEAGADDYLAKPFNPVLLRARISACFEKKRLRDQEQATYQALVNSQRQLAAELAEAGAYVSSLLPPPRSAGCVRTEWCFQPCTQLGGDGFGYHWINDEYFAVYLLDVCGHGVGAALLAVSALNVLRSTPLWLENITDPARILASLNSMFPMEAQNQQYFTLWLGLYSRTHQQLTFATAGHPPAALLLPVGDPVALRTMSPPIGAYPNTRFTAQTVDIPPGSELFILSDGVYEIGMSDGKPGTYGEFLTALCAARALPGFALAHCLDAARLKRGSASLEDDYSLLHLSFAGDEQSA